MVKQLSVEADVGAVQFFPGELRVSKIIISHTLRRIVWVADVIGGRRDGSHRQILPSACSVLISEDAIAASDFEVVDPADVAHEIFLGDAPGCGACGEGTELVSRGKAGRAVPPGEHIEVIFAVIVVADAGKVAYQYIVSVQLVISILITRDVDIAQIGIIRGDIGVDPGGLPAHFLMAAVERDVDVVFAKVVRIVDIQLSVEAGGSAGAGACIIIADAGLGVLYT